MSQSQRERNKLHKRIGKAVAARTAAIVTANEREAVAAPKPVPFGPQANRGGCSRDRLKAGSYGVGFQGPRGFGTPTGKVGKQEANGERMASITPRPSQAPTPTMHLASSKRFAGDSSWAGETLGYDYSTPAPSETVQKRKGKGRWKKA